MVWQWVIGLRHNGVIVVIVAMNNAKWRFPQQPRVNSVIPAANPMSCPRHGPSDWVFEHWCRFPNKVVSIEFYASPQGPVTEPIWRNTTGLVGNLWTNSPIIPRKHISTVSTVQNMQNSKTMFGHRFSSRVPSFVPTITSRHNMTTVDKPTSWSMQMHDDGYEKSNAVHRHFRTVCHLWVWTHREKMWDVHRCTTTKYTEWKWECLLPTPAVLGHLNLFTRA